MPVALDLDSRRADVRVAVACADLSCDEAPGIADWEWDLLLAGGPSLLDADPDALTPVGRLEQLSAIQRERSRLAALEARVLVSVAGERPRARTVRIDDRSVTVEDEACDLIAAALHRSPLTVRRQVGEARRLTGDLAATGAALADGRLSVEQAAQLVRHAPEGPPATVRRYERSVLPRAEAMTPGEVGSLARRVRARVDRAGEEGRRRAARKHVDVRIWAEDDGLACLQARLPLADAARVHSALQWRSREVDLPCDASMGQRRVTALVEALCGVPSEDDDAMGAATSSGGAPAPSGRVGVEVQVTIDLSTLLGLGDEPALVRLGTGRAEPVTADALRELLADPAVALTLRRLVTDPLSGALIDRGRTAYRVPDALRAFLVARDGTCRFPGCSRPAESCDIDHARPWDEGGATSEDNLGPLCRRHHVLKTHAGWRIVGTRADSTTTWQGPDGELYVFRPLRT